MKYIRTFEQHRNTSKIDENFLINLKDKVKNGFNNLKGKLFIKSIYSVLPKELIELIKNETGSIKTNESYEILLEEFKSYDELEKMSDDEYNQYLNDVASKTNFQVDIEGNPLENKEFFEFLKSKGIGVNTTVAYQSKPSMDKIDKMINNMNVGPAAKKLIKTLSYCLFFYMIFIKIGGGTAHAANVDKGFDNKAGSDKSDLIGDKWKEGGKDGKKEAPKDSLKPTSNTKLVEKIGVGHGILKNTIDLKKIYKSGEYKVDKVLLDKQIEILKNIDLTKYKIEIVSSESKVNNYDAETKLKLNPGELADKRANFINDFLKAEFGENIKIDIKPIIGKTEWSTKLYKSDPKNYNPKLDKYTKEQFVKINLYDKNTIFDYESSFEGKAGSEQNNFVADYGIKQIDLDNLEGYSNAKLIVGSIPDRMVVSMDGKVLYDSGYFSDKELNDKDFKICPKYVYELSKMNNIEAKGTPIIKTFQNFDDLIKSMLKSGSQYDHNKSKLDRNEYESSIKNLKKLWDGGMRSFVFYDVKTAPETFKMDITKENKQAEIKIYSPIGADSDKSSTGYKLILKGDGKKVN